NTNRRPSRAAAQLICPAFAGSTFGRERMARRAAITETNDTALITYTQPIPSVAITIPASDGPTIDDAWNMIVLRLIALDRCSRGTRLGTSACRAGASNAPTAETSAASRYSGQTALSPEKVSTPS